MSEIYAPQRHRIAIASSFEGIINNGASECALTSLNAYHRQDPTAFAGRTLTPEDFKTYRDSPVVQGFLALRPLVEIAEDYRTVLDIIARHPEEVEALVADPHNTTLYHSLSERFDTIKTQTEKEREAFGRGKESLFYTERAALKKADLAAWMGTQGVFPDTLPQFRLLVNTQQWEGSEPISGFYPRFATSKDEATAHTLCSIYTQTDRLRPDDVEGERCLIPRDGIIGMETVPDRNKVTQLDEIGRRLSVPRTQVWRLNDMYNPPQQAELNAAGFTNQFFLPGYTSPVEIGQAREDPHVKILDRRTFAHQLAEYAREWGF
ncbi:hypothetical protein ACFLQN_03005 [Candidatus Aenigmatarchaeota archaeon]